MRGLLVWCSIGALVVAGSSAAVAEPPSEQLAAVFDAKDGQALVAVFAGKVRLAKLRFEDASCDEQFGQGKRRTIAAKDHARLAECIMTAPWRPRFGVLRATKAGARYHSGELGSGATIDVTFRSAKDGSFRITKVAFRPERKSSKVIDISSMKLPSTEAGDGDGDGATGAVDGAPPCPAPRGP